MLRAMRVQYKSGGATVAAEVESPVVLIAGSRAWAVVMVGTAPVLTPIDLATVPPVTAKADYVPQSLPHVSVDRVTPPEPVTPVQAGVCDSTGVPFDPVVHEPTQTRVGRWKRKRGLWGPRAVPAPAVVAPVAAPVVRPVKSPPVRTTTPVRAAREAGLKSNSAPQAGGGAGWWYGAEFRGKGHYFVYNPGRSLCRNVDLHAWGLMQAFSGDRMGENACPDCVAALAKRQDADD